jgi:hypothetical protein
MTAKRAGTLRASARMHSYKMRGTMLEPIVVPLSALIVNTILNVLTLVVLVVVWADFREHKHHTREKLGVISNSWIGPVRSSWPPSPRHPDEPKG